MIESAVDVKESAQRGGRVCSARLHTQETGVCVLFKKTSVTSHFLYFLNLTKSQFFSSKVKHIGSLQYVPKASLPHSRFSTLVGEISGNMCTIRVYWKS